MVKSKQTEKVKKVSAKVENRKKDTRSWPGKYFLHLIVFGFAFILYLNSIPNDYNLDDNLVTINHRLTSRGISAIPAIFTSHYYEDESGYS